MKPTTTWILIADGGRAQLFANHGPGKGVEAVVGGAFDADHRADHEIVSDKKGRTHEFGRGDAARDRAAHRSPPRA